MFKTAISSLLASLLLCVTVPAWAADKSKDEDTIKPTPAGQSLITVLDGRDWH